MIKTNNYYIRVQQRSCTIATNEKEQNFVFREPNKTLKFESQIRDFFSFEEECRDQLKQLNYKIRPWSKNHLYFSIPNDLGAIQRRSYFDCADHLDATEVFLLRENVAILLDEQFDAAKTYLIVGLFDSKIEFSVMKNYRFKFLKSYLADSALLTDINHFNRLITTTIQDIKSNHKIDEYWCIYERRTEAPSSIRNFKRLANKNELIIEGLKKAERQQIDRLVGRLKL